MKTKTYDEAFELVMDSAAVIVNCSEVTYAQCDDDDMTITISSEHSEDIININEKNNEFVTVKEGNLVFLDSEENKITIKLLNKTYIN